MTTLRKIIRFLALLIFICLNPEEDAKRIKKRREDEYFDNIYTNGRWWE